jgi:hypothetical protein
VTDDGKNATRPHTPTRSHMHKKSKNIFFTIRSCTIVYVAYVELIYTVNFDSHMILRPGFNFSPRGEILPLG